MLIILLALASIAAALGRHRAVVRPSIAACAPAFPPRSTPPPLKLSTSHNQPPRLTANPLKSFPMHHTSVTLRFTCGRTQFVRLPLMSLVSCDASEEGTRTLPSIFEWYVSQLPAPQHHRSASIDLTPVARSINMLPFSLHLAWISVATVANINISLVASNTLPSTQIAGAILTLFCPVAFALWSVAYR
jgi:hypothetical protein